MPEDKKTKAEELEQLKVTLREWQKVEDGSVENTTLILEKTQNPLIRLVMEILRQDSVMHKRVQQAILDSLEKEAFTLQPEELGEIWYDKAMLLGAMGRFEDALKSKEIAEKLDAGKEKELLKQASKVMSLKKTIETTMEIKRLHFKGKEGLWGLGEAFRYRLERLHSQPATD